MASIQHSGLSRALASLKVAARERHLNDRTLQDNLKHVTVVKALDC
jgi:hypothetical protein